MSYAEESHGPKTGKSGGALVAQVAVRIADILTDLFLLLFWFSEDAWWKFWIQMIIFIATGTVGAIVAYIRQKHFERKHDPNVSAFLGLSQLQLLVELKDSVNDGTKTTCLKLLLNYGTLTESVPSAVFQSFVGWNEFEWGPLLFSSVILSLLSVSLTVVSAEKESYISRGLGKLPLLSTYSLVLSWFRLVEMPARFLSLTLFAAAFGWWVLLLIAIDIVVLRIIRWSTHRRIRVKKETAKMKVTRSLEALNKTVEDLEKLADIMDEDTTGVEYMSPTVLAGHLFIWVFVFVDGVDIYPYVVLRMVEEGVMVALFVLSNRTTLEDDYQLWVLVILALYLAAHLLAAATLGYFRSHAEFLNPKKDKEDIKMKIFKLIKQGETQDSTSESSDSESSVSDLDSEIPEESLKVDKVEVAPLTQANVAALQEVEEESSSDDTASDLSTIDSGNNAYDLPNNVMTEVVIREVEVNVPIPDSQKRTQGVQYDFRDYEDVEPEVTPTQEPDVKDVTNNANRACTVGSLNATAPVATQDGAQSEEQCSIM